jgi:tetratricopeptide (TPR) repeat protein
MMSKSAYIDKSFQASRKPEMKASRDAEKGKAWVDDRYYVEDAREHGGEREDVERRSSSFENSRYKQREADTYSLWSCIDSVTDEVKTETKPTEKKGSLKSNTWSLLSWTRPAGSIAGQENEQEGLSLASTKDEGTANLLGELNSLPSMVGYDSVNGGRSFAGSELIEIGSRGDGSVIERAASNLKHFQFMDGAKSDDLGHGDGESAFIQRRNLLVNELKETVASNGRYDVKCANISVALGDVLLESGQHEQAIKLHKDAVAIYSCKLGDDDDTTLAAKIRLGNIYEEASLYSEAIHTYYHTTVMKRSLLGETDPSVADGYVLLAQVLRKKKDYAQGIKELKRALKIYREALGDSHDKVSRTVDEIASLHVTIGDFGKSAAILEEVVKLKAATHGVGHPSVAASLCTLATTYECSSNFEKAMKTLKKAYKIYTDINGYSSEESTVVLNRMAQLYEATSDYHRAAIAYLGVLRGRKASQGPKSLIVGETYYRLGRVLRRNGQLEKALKCMKEALPLFVKKAVALTDAEMIAEIMHEMALINKDRKNHADAAKIFKQELSVRRKIGQPEFPIIARTLNHLGVAEFEIANHSHSLKFLVEALNIFQRNAKESVDCAEVLFNTALVFEAVKKDSRALDAFTEAARIFMDHGYSSSHPHLQKANYKIEKLRRRGIKSSKNSDGNAL